jgi:hypothetical protein
VFIGAFILILIWKYFRFIRAKICTTNKFKMILCCLHRAPFQPTGHRSAF